MKDISKCHMTFSPPFEMILEIQSASKRMIQDEKKNKPNDALLVDECAVVRENVIRKQVDAVVGLGAATVKEAANIKNNLNTCVPCFYVS